MKMLLGPTANTRCRETRARTHAAPVLEAAGGAPAFRAAFKLQGSRGAWCLRLRLAFPRSGALLPSFVVLRIGQQLYPTQFQLHTHPPHPGERRPFLSYCPGAGPALPTLGNAAATALPGSAGLCWVPALHPLTQAHPGCREGPYVCQTS